MPARSRVPGRLFHNRQDSDGGQEGWRGWQADFHGAPPMFFITTADGWGSRRFDMQAFGLGGDGTLWQNRMDPDGTWHNWQALFPEEPKFDFVTAVQGASGRLEVFGIQYGAFTALWHNQQDSGGDWTKWQVHFQGANWMQDVTAAMGPSGNLEVFAIGTDGTLYHNYQHGNTWHEWVAGFQGAPHVSDVLAIVGAIDGNLEVFAIGAEDGTLYHNWQSGHAWHDWTPNFMGAPRVRSLTAAVGSGPNLHVFGVTVDGFLAHLVQVGKDRRNWQEWDPNFLVGPRMLSATVAEAQHAQLELFAVDAEHRLLRTWQDPFELTNPFNGWHPWQPKFQGAPYSGFLTAALGGGSPLHVNPQLEVFLISPPIIHEA